MSVLYCCRHCFNESHVEPQQCVWLAVDRTVCSLSFLSCFRGHGHKQVFISVPVPPRPPFPPPPSSTVTSITQKNFPVNSDTVKATVSKTVQHRCCCGAASVQTDNRQAFFRKSAQIQFSWTTTKKSEVCMICSFAEKYSPNGGRKILKNFPWKAALR